MVRGVGSRVPLHPARAGRPGVRQGPARAAAREWYMHPNGQLPAYEWAFGDVNPPVHAWAAWRVYKIDQKRQRQGRPAVSRARVPQAAAQLHVVGQPQGRRGEQHLRGRLPRPRQHRRVRPQQARRPAGTSSSPTARAGWRCTRSTCWPSPWSWPTRTRRTKTSPASSGSTSSTSRTRCRTAATSLGLWDETDGFFYDVLHTTGDDADPAEGPIDGGPDSAVRGRDARGLATLERFAGFRRRMEWFLENRQDLTANIASMRAPGQAGAGCSRSSTRPAAPHPQRDARRARVPLAARHPGAVARPRGASVRAATSTAEHHVVDYEPAESTTGLFGGNSNWRGPIWFPVNYLLIESLQKFHYYYGDEFTVECPTGSGRMMTLWEVAAELSRRLSSLFLRGADGRRPVARRRERVPARSALARPRPLLRVLPRRHRRGARRQPSDRLDRAGRQAACSRAATARADDWLRHRAVALHWPAWLRLFSCGWSLSIGASRPQATPRQSARMSSTCRRRRRSSTRCWSWRRSDRHDVVYDLGCGDGRIPIAAAQKYGARGVGIDIDPERIEEATENAKAAGVTGTVTFRPRISSRATSATPPSSRFTCCRRSTRS